MKQKTRIVIASIFAFALMPASVLFAEAQPASPQETLKQYVTDLQRNPSDTALREKIIKLALEMNSPPEIPAEAKKYMARGIAAVEGAKTEADFNDACVEFTKAVNVAPWLGVGYRNLAVVQDKAGMYDAALKSLSFYLLTKPSDVEWADELRAKIEYRKEKAAKDRELAAKKVAEETLAKESEAERKKAKMSFEGRWYENTEDTRMPNFYAFTISKDSTGNYIVKPPTDEVFPDPHVLYQAHYVIENVRINGRNIRLRLTYTDRQMPWQKKDLNLTLTDDGLLVGTYYMVTKDGRNSLGGDVIYRRK